MTPGRSTHNAAAFERILNGHPAVLPALAAVLGGLAALGQAPFDQPLALVIAFAAAFALWRRRVSVRGAAILGWAFGSGYFALALAWIVEPFQVDAARHGWMAPFALVFMSTGLALFWGAAFGLARWLSERGSGVSLVVTFTATEMLRAYVLTGFPWASPAQVLVEGPASRLLAWGGPHAGSFCVLLLAWLLSLPARGDARGAVLLGKGALLFAAVLAFHLPLAYSDAPRSGHVVRLVQPNAEQHLKWQPDMAELFYVRQLDLIASRGAAEPDLIVLPETAIPWRLESAAPALAQIAEAARGVPVALGVLRTAEGALRNSAAVLGPDGAPVQVYDKHHLVPFGEYIPLSALAGRFGLFGLAANGMGFASGAGPLLFDLGPLGRALPLICYEAVFAQDVSAAPARPDFLMQLTNDAWFGKGAGPRQHLAQARMRAIEQGLPLMRSANTGISAMIDPYGRITGSLELGEAGVIDAALPLPLAPTPYARAGDLPTFILLAAALGALTLRRLRRRVAR